jgi:hypothetical protein
VLFLLKVIRNKILLCNTFCQVKIALDVARFSIMVFLFYQVLRPVFGTCDLTANDGRLYAAGHTPRKASAQDLPQREGAPCLPGKNVMNSETFLCVMMLIN